MDLTAATAAITAVGTDIGTVADGIVLLAAAVMAFRWIKAMFF